MPTVLLTWLIFAPPRHLPPVDAFALDAGVRARATARGVRGGTRGPAPLAFAQLSGREGGRHDKQADRARMDKILGRDPHAQDLLETLDDILQQ